MVALIFLTALTALPSPGETVAGSVTDGKAVFFNRCVSCHEPPSTLGLTEEDRARNEAALPADKSEATPTRGPSLSGLIGRKAGSLAGYRYSDAMKAADVIWTTETLQRFLAKPAAFVPGNRMPFNGLRREGEMENLMAYLEAAAK